MKIILLLLVFVAVCRSKPPSTVISSIFNIAVRNNPTSCEGQTGGIVCKNCDTALLCDRKGNVLREAKCKEISPNKPYCDAEKKDCVTENSCISSLQLNCDTQGFFPHPLTCQKFLFCEAASKKPQIYDCPGKTKYDHLKKTCTMRACTSLSDLCKTNQNKYLAHPDDPSIFVYCYERGVTSELYACENKKEVMTGWGQCEVSCRSEGIYMIPEDPKKFMMCYLDGKVLKREDISCYEGTTFKPGSEEESGFCMESESATEQETDDD